MAKGFKAPYLVLNAKRPPSSRINFRFSFFFCSALDTSTLSSPLAVVEISKEEKVGFLKELDRTLGADDGTDLGQKAAAPLSCNSATTKKRNFISHGFTAYSESVFAVDEPKRKQCQLLMGRQTARKRRGNSKERLGLGFYVALRRLFGRVTSFTWLCQRLVH
jgi:hypothetical protein